MASIRGEGVEADLLQVLVLETMESWGRVTPSEKKAYLELHFLDSPKKCYRGFLPSISKHKHA